MMNEDNRNTNVTTATEETTSNKKRLSFDTSSNPNDSAFMLDELLLRREFPDEE